MPGPPRERPDLVIAIKRHGVEFEVTFNYIHERQRFYAVDCDVTTWSVSAAIAQFAQLLLDKLNDRGRGRVNGTNLEQLTAEALDSLWLRCSSQSAGGASE